MVNWSRPSLDSTMTPMTPVVVEHRRQEHRLIEVGLRARDGRGACVVRGIRQVLGDAVLGDPAGDALAHGHRSCSLASSVYSPISPRHATGYDVLAADAVDAHVVVVDELAQLEADGLADLAIPWSVGRAGVPSCWMDCSWAPTGAARPVRRTVDSSDMLSSGAVASPPWSRRVRYAVAATRSPAAVPGGLVCLCGAGSMTVICRA